MSIKNKGSQSYSSSPTFGAEGQDLLNSLKGLFEQDPTGSAGGQYFLDNLRGGNPEQAARLNDQIGLITAQSDAQLPNQLAEARSFTRNRPDTYSNQVGANVTQDNRIGRDLAISQLLREQGNQDTLTKMGSASALASLDANRFGQGASLLSMLRGEQGTGASSSSQFNPYQLISSVGGFMGDTSSAAKPK